VVLNFGSIQRETSDFVETRQAMDRLHPEDDDEPPLDRENYGILDYIEVTNRGNFLILPAVTS